MLVHITSFFKRFLKLPAVFLAVLALSAGLAGCNLLGKSSNDNPYADLPSPIYSVSFNDEIKVTQIVDLRDDTVLYENGWSDADKAFESQPSSFTISTDAELKLDDGSIVSGNTQVLALSDDVAKLAESFNKLDSAKLEPSLTDETSWGIDLMTLAVAGDILFGDDSSTVQFELASEEKTQVETNSTVADGYNKGLAAWQVMQGSEGYSANIEYEYDFMCVMRPVVQTVDSESNLNELGQASGLELTRFRGEFNGNSVYWFESDQPCRISSDMIDMSSDKSRP